MRHVVDQERLIWGSVGACVVAAGSVLLDGGHQGGWSPGLAASVGGPVLVAGWAVAAHALSRNKARVGVIAAIWASAAAIAAATIAERWLVMQQGQRDVFHGGGEDVPEEVPEEEERTIHLRRQQRRTPATMGLAAFFCVAWIVLAWLAGNGLLGSVVALTGAVLLIVGVQAFLPAQRAMEIVDGPGLLLYALGWALIVVANSTVDGIGIPSTPSSR